MAELGTVSPELPLETLPAVAGDPRPQPRSLDEPPPGTWFHRKVNLIHALRELWSFRELVATLAERDLRVRYKQAVLGIGWALFMPLLLMLVFSFVFTKFGQVNTHGAPYSLYAYLGLLPWTFFSTSLAVGGVSLLVNIPLLNKLYCPREVFPLAAVGVALADAVIASLVLLVMFPLTGFSPQLETYYVPLLIAILLTFTIGLTVAVSALTVFMRDLRVVLPAVVQLGLFVTPVAYGAHTVAETNTQYLLYSAVNPLVPVIDGLRRVVLYGQAPEWAAVAIGGLSSLIILVGGFALFKRLETGMADNA